MAQGIWSFEVSPDTITEVTFTNGTSTLTATPNGVGTFFLSYSGVFDQGEEVSASATGYNDETVNIGYGNKITFTPSNSEPTTIAGAIAAAQQKVADIYTAVSNKGGTLPVTQNLSNLPTAINSISGGASTKYGLSLDNIVGNIDNNDVLNSPSGSASLVFTGAEDIAANGLEYVFYKNSTISSVSFPDLTGLSNNYGLYHTFQYSDVSSISFPELLTVTSRSSFESTFADCGNLTSASFPKLQSVTGREAFKSAFDSAGLTSVSFPVLTQIGADVSSNNYGQFANAFKGTSITSLSFPELTTIYCTGSASTGGTFYYNPIQQIYLPKLSTITYGTGAGSTSQKSCTYIFSYCNFLTEIHFGAANKTAIESTDGYSTLWGRGAGNATVYFDL